MVINIRLREYGNKLLWLSASYWEYVWSEPAPGLHLCPNFRILSLLSLASWVLRMYLWWLGTCGLGCNRTPVVNA